VAAQLDLRDAGGSILDLAPGLGAAAAPVVDNGATVTTTTSQGPVTRLSRGITKPKLYTYGTVRWGMLGTVGADAEEPSTVQEALRMRLI
jgi:hypothetical protein